jgi:DNA-binding response OmpR family regulator
MPKKVLIVDDDPKICALLGEILRESGYESSVAHTTEQGWDQVHKSIPDVILLDVEIPLKGGFEFCREIKEQDPYRRIPIIFLTVRDQEMDRVSALNIGADDFILKPFRQKELLARIQVALRRAQPYQPAMVEIQTGTLSIHFEKRIVKVAGKIVHITPKEMDLFKCLILNRHRVLIDCEFFEVHRSN